MSTTMETKTVTSATNERVEVEPDLARRTLRTVAILVGVWVVFVGALSVTAVAVTSHAVGDQGAAELQKPEKPDTVAPATPATPKKPSSGRI